MLLDFLHEKHNFLKRFSYMGCETLTAAKHAELFRTDLGFDHKVAVHAHKCEAKSEQNVHEKNDIHP